jgi:hypothetical protein
MTRIIKIIQFFFMFLAVSVLNAHMIIPHDHHIADSGSCHDNSFPVSKNGHTRHPGFPPHCHAFNDLTTEKAITYQVIKQVQANDFMSGSIHCNAASAIQLSWIRIVDVLNQPVISCLPELSSLRAPPDII